LAFVPIAITGGCPGEASVEGTAAPGSGFEATAEALPPGLQLILDAGNAAFRDGRHAEALNHFSTVVRLDPQLAAGWYGVGITQSAMGNAVAADSAMRQVHALAPDIPLEHPVGQAPPNPHPIQAAPDTAQP
jgi:Flp pilus assembly protein TadD